MDADRDLLLKAALAGLANHHRLGIVRHLRRRLRHVEIALGPGMHDIGHVGSIAAAAQKVIGACERYEAFRVLGSGKDAARVLNADDLVRRRMEDKQCLAQIGNAREELVFGEVVHEGTADVKSTACEHGLDLARGGDFVEAVLEQAGHMGGIAGRSDGCHGARLGYLASRREHRGTPEAVADEDRGGAGAMAQFVGGRDEIGDIGGKGRVGEFPFAGA